jgi:hypothetical protein
VSKPEVGRAAVVAKEVTALVVVRHAGDSARAAEIALWLVVEHATSLGDEVAAGGWFKRAERLLAEAPLCRALAELEVQRGQRCADPAEAQRHFARAVEIGKHLGAPIARCAD